MNREDQDHTSSSCVDCMSGKKVDKACSFPSAAQRKCHCLSWSLFSRKKHTFQAVIRARMFSDVNVNIGSVGDVQHCIS